MNSCGPDLRQELSEADLNLCQRSALQGGRSLNAIWKNPQLNIYEKAFLNTLGSECNFTGDFLDMVIMPRWKIAERCTMSEDTLTKTVKALQEKGYIIKTQRKNDINEDLANGYQLTPKLFDEHVQRLSEAKLRQVRGGAGSPPGGGCERPLFSPSSSSPGIQNPPPNTRVRDPGPMTGSERHGAPNPLEAKTSKPKEPDGTFRPTIGAEENKEPIAKMVREAKEARVAINANDLARSIGGAMQATGWAFAKILEVWERGGLLYLIESRSQQPAHQFFNYVTKQQELDSRRQAREKHEQSFKQRWDNNKPARKEHKKDLPPPIDPKSPEYRAYLKEQMSKLTRSED